MVRVVAAFTLLFTGLVVLPPTPARAAGSITLDKSAVGAVLLGGEAEFRLLAANPAGNTDEQYNLSFTDVLAVGVTYVPGSTAPASFGEPSVITITDDAVADPPITHQVLVWSNVSDLTPGATRTLTFRAAVDAEAYPIGSTVENRASAFSSSDPREVPEFDASGDLAPGGLQIVSASDTASTQVSAVRITKTERSPESELLRGVNDHQSVYSLLVTNNGEGSTGEVVVTDLLPAGLEFLGCGGDFNSAEPEYPGASNRVNAVAGCTAPRSVETVLNPDGRPAGVYTLVTWRLDDLDPGERTTITYAAGIPQRENTMTWPATAPSPESLGQAANLDNNTGPSTRETARELSLTNHAAVTGSFGGSAVADETSHSVTAEDLRIVKAVTPRTFSQGGYATYTLTVDTGEYTDASGLVITDELPSGMCPVRTSDPGYTPPVAECFLDQGAAPTGGRITGVESHDDGSFTLTTTPDRTSLDANGRLVITYQALMRPFYDVRLGGPTSASDSFTNHVMIAGTTVPPTAVEAPDPAGEEAVTDESSATIGADSPTLTKLRMPNTDPMRCSDDPDDYARTFDEEEAFGEGDRVCFLLTVDFPSGVDTRNAQLSDFLPSGLTYESSRVLAGADLVSSTSPTAPTSYVTWRLGTGTPRVVAKGSRFQVVLSATVTKPAPVKATPTALDKQNLAKFRYTNTDGLSESLRDAIGVTIASPPVIGLTKGVQSVGSTDIDTGATPGDVDDVVVRGGDVVTYRVDLRNLSVPGALDADDIVAPDVFDVLPAGVTCALVSAITAGGTCYDAGADGRPALSSGDVTSSVIRWTLPASVVLEPQGSLRLTYAVTIPIDVSVSTVFANTAAVAAYGSPTNIDDGDPVLAVHHPRDNVSADVDPVDEDVPPAVDAADLVRTPDATLTKAATTAITETGNTAAQAVVGEGVTYTIGVRVPARTSVFNGRLVDPMPTGVAFVGPATALYSPSGTAPATDPLPAGVTVDPATGTLSFAEAYSNPGDTDQLFVVSVPARIGTATGNTHGVVLTNTATFTSDTVATGGTAITPRTATSDVTVVAPSPTLTKAVSPTSGKGGDTVTYTLRANNTSGRPPLHDTWVVDCLPGSLSFAAFTTIAAGTTAGTPVPGDGTNGCATGFTRIAWRIGSLAGTGANVTLVYTATVTTVPSGGQRYTNTATLTGSTLNDAKSDPMTPDNPLERVLTSTASATLAVSGATIAKSSAQTTLTVGQTGSFTIVVTVPSNTAFYGSAILDTMPTGMSYVADSAITTCVNADSTPCSVPGTVLTPSGSVIGWLVSDLAPSTQVRRVTLTYTARMNDVATNTAGTTRTNTARFAWNQVNGADPTSAGATFDATSSNATASVRVVEPGLTIAKTVDDTTVEPGQTFTYNLTVANNGRTAANLSAAHNITVTDAVPTGVVVDPATIVPTGALTGVDGVGSGGTITWTLPGPLAAAGSVGLTYRATLAPSATLTAATRTNTARVTHYESLATGGRTNYAAVAATATVTPQFPRVTPTKSVAAGPAYLGKSKSWTVTLTNSGGAAAHNVDAVDTLPVNWTYDAGSATVVIAGVAAGQLEPVTSVDTGGRQVLTWSNLGTVPATGANTLEITFTATPKNPDAVTAPGVGSTVPHTNTATAGADDATGVGGNASGPYATGPATASTAIDSADVRLAKTSGDAVAGQSLVYTLTVRNAGGGAASGPFPVVDTLPAGLGAVTATGTGWTCGVSASAVSCTRSNAADTLASGASFPVIRITAAVPASTAGGTVLTNTATVGSTTYDPILANNTAAVTNVVTRSVDLGIAKATSGTVTAGQDATYTLDVTNHGPSDSSGPIAIADTLPSGTTFVSASGTGWVCAASGRDLTCTRATGLVFGQAAPQVTVVVSVPAPRTGNLVNTASVDGPEPDPTTGNDTATVTDPIRTSADLALTKVHEGTFTPGGNGTYRLSVTNHGPSDAATVRISDQLAPELRFVSDDAADWSCSADAANLLTCALAGSLGAGDSREFTIAVAIDSAHVGEVVNSATVSSATSDPHLGNNTDGDTTGVSVRADLGIEKSHSGDATAGANLAFELRVTNHGESDSPGPITVSDTIPAWMSYVSAAGGGWTCSAVGQVVTCTRAAGLAADANTSITLTVAVAPGAGPGVLTNRASVAGTAPDPNPANNTDADAVTVVDRANVRLTKTADPTTVAAGATVTYTLAVHNDGPSNADNVQVSDALPAGLEYVGLAADTALTCEDANPIDCRIATMAAGATHRVRVTARVGSGVADGTEVVNEATVSTSTPGDDPDDNSDSAAVEVVTRADLRLAKSHPDTAVVAGAQMTFDLAVHNAGPSDAAADIVVTDTLPDGMTFLSNTEGWSCSASGQEVTCTLDDGAALLAGDDAPALELTVGVDADLDPEALVDGVLSNVAGVSSPTTDPVEGNNFDDDAVAIRFEADLSITKAHPQAVRVGDPLDFTLQVANVGPSAARGVTVTDTLPAGLEYVAATGTGWTCAAVGQDVTCDLYAPLASGAEVAPITVTVTVLASAHPGVTNTAEVDAVTTDPEKANNSAADPVAVPPQVDLGITKSHSPEPLQVGDRATYTLGVSNAGATDDPGPITVTDSLPAGLSFVSGAGDGWSCAAVAADVTCVRAEGLVSTGTSGIVLEVEVGPEAFPGVTNTAVVASPAEDTNPENNTATDPAAVLPLYDLEIEKELASISGTRADWTITVTNHGPNEAPDGVVVVDDLPPELSFVDFTGDGWTCAPLGQLVTCGHDQPIDAGESVAFTLRAAIDSGASGTVVNSASIPGGATDSASGRIPSDSDDLAFTGGLAVGVGILGVIAVLGGLLLVRVRRGRG